MDRFLYKQRKRSDQHYEKKGDSDSMQMKSLEMTHLSLINFRFRALYLSSGASPYSISFFYTLIRVHSQPCLSHYYRIQPTIYSKYPPSQANWFNYLAIYLVNFLSSIVILVSPLHE